ncbi:DNA repair protein RecN [Sphingomonas paeninsulae]|uniref:DNA repair protein RecN n=1 Tax=Sphingomonas paeninsulae TaxID=2319844 RepID=A0A494TIQ9_SPHPE|nr:DNA repair protein RecN [Sphingomonas paeninsulae]AYJ87384.1 DNA repair protein RecN [Sphingomonas paeninsulae]
MLLSLSIRDVVLIEALDLEFRPGLVVITGETGAGKSILLDALGLALGDRAASGLVRQGAAQASVAATFEHDVEAAKILIDNDILCDASEPLIVRRTLKWDGKSRAFVNDQPVSGALLREFGSRLVEIHGQHDDRGLLAPTGHRALLDIFGRIDLGQIGQSFAAMRAADIALETAKTALDDATRDRDWLTHTVAELDEFAPEEGEEEELADRRANMQRGERLSGELEDIMALVEGADGALPKLRAAARALDRVAREHTTLAEALAAIDRAIIEGAVADEQLQRAASLHVFDPAQLEADETRLFDLRALARKHRVTPDALATFATELRAKLNAIEEGGAGIDRLIAQAAAARTAYRAAADVLTKARTAAALRLDKAVANELAPLKLDAARFRTAVAPGNDSEQGADRVEFEISTNPGAPFAPLTKIASGGELSRFILALKVALAEEGGAGTMIFDEIDRGVGGAVASAIGERLARLADTRQVLVVTHSPQVAARGGEHLLIAKNSDGLVTRTNLRTLDAEARQEEIARMLSGNHVTEEARAQAARLVEAA